MKVLRSVQLLQVSDLVSFADFPDNLWKVKSKQWDDVRLYKIEFSKGSKTVVTVTLFPTDLIYVHL